jgi:formylmethanofuran dehydrogenase subunit E
MSASERVDVDTRVRLSRRRSVLMSAPERVDVSTGVEVLDRLTVNPFEDTQMDYPDIVAFHGHTCPGLAIGYRMAMAALERLNTERAEDEEIVAIVENDACGVDALQCLTGCTFGKGNLIFHDYGKQVYTLFSRRTGRGVRVCFHGRGLSDVDKKDREAHIRQLFESPAEAMMDITSVTLTPPDLAQRRKSIDCSRCGEAVMETRIQWVEDKPCCIPCSSR